MEFLGHFFASIGLLHPSFRGLVWILVGLALIYLAVRKKFQPLFFVTLGFGIVMGNMPHSVHSWGNLQFHQAFWVAVSSGVLPALLFLSIGAMTDFSCLIASPRLALLAGASQIGLLIVAVIGAVLGFAPPTAAALALAGGGFGPVAIFTSAILDPRTLGIVALAAYAILALAPVIQPPILRLLTTRQERLIRMTPPPRISRRMRILFPILGFVLCTLLVPSAMVLLGMLFLGNLLRETGITERLDKILGSAHQDLLTILLALAVGLSTAQVGFVSWRTIGLVILGPCAFALATASGVLFAKFLNLFARKKINPLIGGAGLTATPVTARISQQVAAEEDPENQLLLHAMAPNLAGLIALALTSGLFISMLQ